MKIRTVTHNNRKKAFEIRTSTKALTLPYPTSIRGQPRMIQLPLSSLTRTSAGKGSLIN